MIIINAIILWKSNWVLSSVQLIIHFNRSFHHRIIVIILCFFSLSSNCFLILLVYFIIIQNELISCKRVRCARLVCIYCNRVGVLNRAAIWSEHFLMCMIIISGNENRFQWLFVSWKFLFEKRSAIMIIRN